jgi:hypothetical protein
MAFVAALALGPVVFWYWASYRPLNGYGEKVANRLKQIESDLNKIYFSPFNKSLAQNSDATDGASSKTAIDTATVSKYEPKLDLFTDFSNKTGPRVRTPVTIFGWSVTALFVVFAVATGYRLCAGNSLVQQKDLQLVNKFSSKDLETINNLLENQKPRVTNSNSTAVPMLGTPEVPISGTPNPANTGDANKESVVLPNTNASPN